MIKMLPSSSIDALPRNAACRLVAVTALAVMLAGCRPAGDGQTTHSESPTHRSVRRGPVTLTVKADRDAVVVGDTLRVTIDAFAPPGVTVDMPHFDDAIGEFDIKTRRLPPDIPDGDGRRWTHRYELSTFESGELVIPPVTARFTDHRAAEASEAGAAEPIEGELTTDPLPIVVSSVLAADDEPGSFRDIKDAVPVDVPRDADRFWLTAGVSALVLAAAIVLLFLLLRRMRARGGAAEPVPLPHVWAFWQLDRLDAEDLLARQLLREYYSRLSDIVRRYIERRFALMAPERTTEEFLRDAGRSRLLSRDHKDLLAGFLREADMVKFALHRPPADDGRRAMDAARSFISETASEVMPPPHPSATQASIPEAAA